MRSSFALACAAVMTFAGASSLSIQDAAAKSGAHKARIAKHARIDANGNATRSAFEMLAAKHASANGIPLSLVHRVIMRESRYNPRAVSKGNYGIMQIRLGTARALGYSGTAEGLLDADTNMTYAVRYLAGAYHVAGGNQDRAVGLYARGYYYDAKRKGLNAYALSARTATPVSALTQEASAEPAAVERSESTGANPDVSIPDRLTIH